uniref:Uncharacterized protein n=1 Tax=viral metagenome TaxID=1070528 RepID=A0A6C0BW12_9ZZZZ
MIIAYFYFLLLDFLLDFLLFLDLRTLRLLRRRLIPPEILQPSGQIPLIHSSQIDFFLETSCTLLCNKGIVGLLFGFTFDDIGVNGGEKYFDLYKIIK